jgi:hypothetical protein
MLLDPWPNAGRRSFAALGCVESPETYQDAPGNTVASHSEHISGESDW